MPQQDCGKTADCGGSQKDLEGTDILVAAGRTPNTRGIGLEQHGIELTDRGYIRVNERLETTAADTWAIGECAGSAQFTHISLDDFRVVRDNLAGGHRSKVGRLVPYCMFIDPPLARVGGNMLPPHSFTSPRKRRSSRRAPR